MNITSSGPNQALIQAVSAFIQQLVAHPTSTSTTAQSATGTQQSAAQAMQPPTATQNFSAQPPTATGSELSSSQQDSRTQELVAVITEIAQLLLHTQAGAASGGAGGAANGVSTGTGGAGAGAYGAGTTSQGSAAPGGTMGQTSAAPDNTSTSAVASATGATGQVGTGNPMLASASQGVQPGLANANTSTQPVPGTGPAVVAKPTQATYGGWQDFATKQNRSSYQTNTYAGLAQNKASVLSAIKASGATPQESALVMACAMKETANMSASTAQSPNLFNMNIGMLHDLGYQGDGSDLGDPSKAVPWMVKAIRTFGPEGFLAYHRAGPTGYIDGKSFDVAGYTDDASRIYNILMANPQLMTNDQRVE